MDYIKLLNLQSEPFSNSPDPSFFYLSPAYQDCLQNLEISVRLRRGLNLVLGDIGIGKTTLSRALIQQFQSEADRFQFHLILDPSFESENEFLYALIMGFGINRPVNDSLFAYKESIRQFLLDEGLQKGRVIVLIVDEGQKLNGVCLELLRDLLNFETNQFKLLQLIIMAQREFHEKVREKRNLTDRINTFYEIRPLSRNETQDMIQFRLQKAGWTKSRPLFSSGAIDRIYRLSGGYPRRIITLCHHSLLFMLIRKADIVEPEMVEQAVSQLYEYKEESNKTRNASVTAASVHNKPKKPGKGSAWMKLASPFTLKRLITPVFLVILCLLLFLTLHWGRRNMDLINLGLKDKTVKKTVVAIKPDIAEPDIKDLETPGPDKGDLDAQALGNMALETRSLDTKTLVDQEPATSEQDTSEQDTREADMHSFPVYAFENKDKFDLIKYMSDIPETAQEKKIKEYHTGPDTDSVSMVASDGDTVFKLARKVYAMDINSAILKKIRQSNPHISDLDHIEVGDRIFFPRLLFSDEGVQMMPAVKRNIN